MGMYRFKLSKRGGLFEQKGKRAAITVAFEALMQLLALSYTGVQYMSSVA
jgi:hypothetical protein